MLAFRGQGSDLLGFVTLECFVAVGVAFEEFEECFSSLRRSQ